MVWTEHVRFSAIAGESAPRMSFAAADVNVLRPAMGRYSWFKAGSLRRISSAWSFELATVPIHAKIELPS